MCTGWWDCFVYSIRWIAVVYGKHPHSMSVDSLLIVSPRCSKVMIMDDVLDCRMLYEVLSVSLAASSYKIPSSFPIILKNLRI